MTVTPLRYEPRKPEKAWFAVACFVGSIGLVFFSGLPISIGFLTGALAMIVGGVLTIEEAYRAVEWKVVFLIAGLIPIGIAMETSRTATLLAQDLINLVEGAPPFLILLTLGGLTTVCSLLMSKRIPGVGLPEGRGRADNPIPPGQRFHDLLLLWLTRHPGRPPRSAGPGRAQTGQVPSTEHGCDGFFGPSGSDPPGLGGKGGLYPDPLASTRLTPELTCQSGDTIIMKAFLNDLSAMLIPHSIVQ